jgi:two-component system sensor kinase FixL
MGQLAAAVTHELNQPLAAILNNAEAIQSLLAESSPDLDEVKAAVADIIEDNTRAGEIIRRLRAFFRRDEPSRQPLDLGNLVAELARVVRSDALIRQISFRLDVSSPMPAIAGDRIQLQQSILNLILNAFDAVSELDGAREVAVEVSAVQSSKVRVIVRDSGKGIAAAALPNIFEPFFTTKPNGMGMGLAISRSIVEGHRGKLVASSNAHGGAVFQITLPALARSIG